MLDIISSSIRIGKYLKEKTQFSELFNLFMLTKSNTNIACGMYFQMLEKEFISKGFLANNYLNQLINANIKNNNEHAKILANQIKNFIDENIQIAKMLLLSNKLSFIIDSFINEVLSPINKKHRISDINSNPKLDQLLVEVSTSIQRTGIFYHILQPKLDKKTFLFTIQEYEQKRQYDRMIEYPYNKKVKKIITDEKDLNKAKIFKQVENIEFIRYLLLRGIVQGFYYDIYEIDSKTVIKIKTLKTECKIFPLVIKLNILEWRDVFITRINLNDLNGYLLAKSVNLNWNKENSETKISGYFYPADEFNLFK